MVLNSSNLENLTDTQVSWTQDVPMSMYQTIAGLLIVAIVIGFLGNILVPVAVLINKRLHMQIYALLSQVAILNALCMAFVVPVNIHALLDPLWLPSNKLCFMIGYMSYILRCTSGLLLLVISFYRCVHVCYSNVYKKIRNSKVVVGLCVFVWAETIALISGLAERVYFSLDYRTCMLEGKYLQKALIIFIYLPMLFVPIAMYLNIVLFVRKAKRRVQTHRSTSSSNYTESNKLTIMTALISLNHLVTAVIPGILISALPEDHTLRGKVSVPIIFLFRITAVVDCFIYFFFNKSIRSSIVDMFTSLKPSNTRNASPGTQLQNISSIGSRGRNLLS